MKRKDSDVFCQFPDEDTAILFDLLCTCAARRACAASFRELAQACCEALVATGNYTLARVFLPAEEDEGDIDLCVAIPGQNADGAAGNPPQTIVLPLFTGGEGSGLFVVPRSEPHSEAALRALQALADDLAFGLQALRAKNAQRRLNEQLRQLSRALESSSNGVMITSSTQLDHPIVYVNPAFERISGYTAEEAVGQSGRFLVRDDLAQKGLNEIRAALRERREGYTILRNYRKSGEMFWNELSISPVRDESGEITTHFVSIINDVSERIAYEQQLEYHATHDALTGLANRNLLHDRINQAILQAKRAGRLVGVLLLDLDRFKLINDGFGHAPGDQLLKAVAERLQHCVRETDTVARLGGDEFVVVAGNIETPESLAGVASKILRQLALPLEVEGKEIFVTASVGIATYPEDGDHGEALLRNADVAMYRVKEHGRNSYRFYAPEMNHMALDRLDMEGNLRRALERDEITVFFQPILSLDSGAIIGAEALVRWLHPRIGMVHPTEFITLAEETGLILPLGERVLRLVGAQIAAWQKAGLPPVRVAVNISARQFRQDDLPALLRQILAETGIRGESLELELTESMVMHDVENAISTLHDLKALGVDLSLDDFGTGYSSLSYLKRFPIDILKIDRSFVSDIDTDAGDAAIARAVIAMAHSLDLRVIAEGVETEAQLRMLREYACDYFQGFLFSRAVPADDFTNLLKEGRQQALPAKK